MGHTHLLPSSTASDPAWQLRLPPQSSQTDETFWSRQQQVCRIKEASWGPRVVTWESRLWGQAALDQNPDLPVPACLCCEST